MMLLLVVARRYNDRLDVRMLRLMVFYLNGILCVLLMLDVNDVSRSGRLEAVVRTGTVLELENRKRVNI